MLQQRCGNALVIHWVMMFRMPLLMLKLFTIFLIALCALSTPAYAQNAALTEAQRSSRDAAEKVQEKAELARIGNERTQFKKNIEKEREACYQQFAVTPCINTARDAHNEKMRDLSRQEVVIHDAQRKRSAADRLRSIDEKNSPAAQQKIAERRGRALQAAQSRQEQSALKASSREAKLAAGAQKPASAASAPSGSPLPTGKPRTGAKDRVVKTPDAAQLEINRQKALKREKAAADRKAEALQREAGRKKPASQSLPVR
jgi:colicin import membrane protein